MREIGCRVVLEIVDDEKRCRLKSEKTPDLNTGLNWQDE